ncbi:MAG TPA: HNH endonuclease signature motif containing protein [Chloroflexota bacterium]|nr:HNH endonuclease signature motif containing protein [Chloroflexota bacterium]
MQSEIISFNGITFRRYPDSKNGSDRVYFTSHAGHRRRGVGRLHEEIWKAANGPIPPEHHIHHRDHNPLNNELDNLDCLPAAEHRALHGNERRGKSEPWHKDALARARAKAAEWHASDAGRAWHSEHGKRTWQGRQPHARICDQCAREFQCITLRDSDRFCSNVCRSQWRRASGVDDEDRICAACGTVFRINRYYKARCCSRTCAQRLRRDQRTAGVQPHGPGRA